MFTTPTTSVHPTSPVAAVRGATSATDLPPAAAPTAPKASAPGQDDAQSQPLAPPPPNPLKLVVAKAEASLAYTYTLVDQVTGRVVAEIPHQAAKDAAASPNYTAGGVVDTTA